MLGIYVIEIYNMLKIFTPQDRYTSEPTYALIFLLHLFIIFALASV